MYKSIRILRIFIAILALAVPTWALIAGYDSVFVRMQIFTAFLTGVAATLVFWAAVTLIYGRIYCSTLCPLGTCMDGISWISRFVMRTSRNYRYHITPGAIRFISLIAALVLMFIGTGILPTLLDPYTAYARMVTEFVMRPLGLESPSVCFGISAFAAAAATALAIVAIAPKRGRLLCNSVCPVGILLGIGSSKAVFHAEIDPDKCINCGLCEQNCKAECIDSKMHTIDYQRCVVCFDCMAVCPNGAISYKTGRNRLSMPMMQSTSASQSQMNSNETIS